MVKKNEKLIGKCPHCNMLLTKKDIEAGMNESYGLLTSLVTFVCIKCSKIISISYGRS